jgi:hypothetical protein
MHPWAPFYGGGTCGTRRRMDDTATSIAIDLRLLRDQQPFVHHSLDDVRLT